VCIQVPCVYLLSAASTVIANSKGCPLLPDPARALARTETRGIFGILGASIVTDGERGECVDPGENGAILDAGGVEDPARQAGERMGS
jgi:hypothetical protein